MRREEREKKDGRDEIFSILPLRFSCLRLPTSPLRDFGGTGKRTGPHPDGSVNLSLVEKSKNYSYSTSWVSYSPRDCDLAENKKEGWRTRLFT